MEGSPDLEALEDRIERRLTALELRHQRQLDRLQAQRDQDATLLQETGTVLQRCEQDLEVVTEWQRDASERFAAAETRKPDPRIEEALAAALGSQSICEKNRAAAFAAVEAVDTRASELAAKLAELDARLTSQDEAVQKVVESGESQRKLERMVGRAADASTDLQSRLDALEQRVLTHQEDLVDLRERWAEQEVERTEASANIEMRLTRFEGTLGNFTEELSMTAAQARSDLRNYVEQHMHQATSELEASKAAIAETREAMSFEMEQLHAERSAMRSAWTRIEALRHDTTWGYFLREDGEWKVWRTDVTRQLESMEQKYQGHEAIWSEIGQLGCRVADVHHLLDERIPPQEGLQRRGPRAAVTARNGRVNVQAKEEASRDRPRSVSLRKYDGAASSKPLQTRSHSTLGRERASAPQGVVDEDDAVHDQQAFTTSDAHCNSGVVVSQDAADMQAIPTNMRVRTGSATSSRFTRRLYADEDLSNLLADT